MSDVRPLLGDDDLVTGEAVALDLPPATVGVRVASGLIDVLAVVSAAGRWSSWSPAWSCRRRRRGAVRGGHRGEHRAGAGRGADHDGDAHPGTLAGQARARPAHGPRRRRADLVPARVHARARRRRGDLGVQRRAGPGVRAGDVARQAARRRGGRHLRGARAVPVPGAAAGADAAAPGRLGGERRHRAAARRRSPSRSASSSAGRAVAQPGIARDARHPARSSR